MEVTRFHSRWRA